MGGRRIMGAVSFVDSRWGVMLLSGKSEGTDMEEVCGGERGAFMANLSRSTESEDSAVCCGLDRAAQARGVGCPDDKVFQAKSGYCQRSTKDLNAVQ